MSDRAQAFARSPADLGVRAGRYVLASAVATGVTELCFVFLYGKDAAGPQLAGVLAFLAGALPKFVLARWWVWRRSGVPGLAEEVLPYILVAAATGLGAGLLTDVAEAAVTEYADQRSLQVWLVGAAFLVSMAVMFALRFIVFDRWVFTDRRLTGRADP